MHLATAHKGALPLNPSSSTAPSRPGADDGDQIGQAIYLTSKQNYEVLIAPGYNPPGRIKQRGKGMGQEFMTALNTLRVISRRNLIPRSPRVNYELANNL